MSSEHEITLKVRDYECDLQGVVNNAVYMNYLEHARHEFLRDRGIDFAAVTRQGIHLVIVRADMRFRASLTSGDEFVVRTRYVRESRLKFVFYQDVVRCSDQAPMLSATMTATALNDQGRPFAPDDILSRLA